MQLERVTANIGAIVHGFDVTARHGEGVSRTLRQWLHEHGVLFIVGDEPTGDDDFRALGSLFGEMYEYSYSKTRSADGLIAYLGYKDGRPPRQVGEKPSEASWHTDGTPNERPPQAALLTPSRLPSVGGDTMWASMTAAYDALSSRLQRMLDGMEAVHSTEVVKRRFSPEANREIFGEGESAVHPVIIRDPFTDRKALFVNSNKTERLVGMKDWESRRLLDMLYDHVNTPEFHVRLRWTMNTIAVWEERVTQHRAVADYDEPRTLRRITIRGDRPVA
jgi:taurine dioxygenase